MKKTIILILTLMSTLSFVISETILELGAIDSDNGTIEVLITTDADFMGFQFDVEGVELTGGSGGISEDTGWDIHASGNTVLGFSLTGDVIPAGSSGVLTVLEGAITGNVCLPFVENTGPEDDTPIFSDSDGQALAEISLGAGDCSLDASLDMEFSLFNAYPNPFNPELNIDISIEQMGNLNVSIYNLTGQHIHTVYNQIASANQVYNLNWDASSVSSGVYIVKVQAPNTQYSKIVNLLK